MTLYEQAFSSNIRRLRKLHGMMQKDLARMTGYSEKTISKWETDGNIPSVDTLFRLAAIFHVNLDALFTDSERRFFLGVDGGGTKTAFALADCSGKIIRQLRLDASNPFDVGIEKTKEILHSGIVELCDGIPMASVSVFAGLAGLKSGIFADSVYQYLGEFGFERYEIGSDNENIIASGLGDSDGITVIMGTGICSFAVCGGQRHRIAGWGYLIDNGGSAYNIGRDALSVYYSAYDGSSAESPLTRRISEMAGGDGMRLLNDVYQNGKKVIASFAEVVYEQAEAGDAVACGILEKNMKEVARVIRSAAGFFSEKLEKIPVVIAGGLTEQSLTMKYLTDALGDTSRFDIKILEQQPVEGAVLIARNLSRKSQK
ncbi:MAG: XRE family transcriptional regulator [Clostridia bacterium]|nr:XRE family transcriptional regulator [Clostridia bacterium]